MAKRTKVYIVQDDGSRTWVPWRNIVTFLNSVVQGSPKYNRKNVDMGLFRQLMAVVHVNVEIE